MFLLKKFIPKAGKTWMSHIGDVAAARKFYDSPRAGNLKFLLEQRYAWMNDWIKHDDCGIEVGAGHGLSARFIKAKGFLLTDVVNNDWIDRCEDALAMTFEDESQDFVIASNMIHHVASPIKFFREVHRVLKPGGVLIIQDIYASFMTRAALRIVQHEGFWFDVDPYDDNAVCNDPNDPWSANCAVINLLLQDKAKLLNKCGFTLIHEKYIECLVLLLSGGVTAKVSVPVLPKAVLRMAAAMDALFVRLSKNTFAMQVQLVLKKA